MSTDHVAAPPSAGWGPARSKTVTWHDPLAALDAGRELSGIDYLRALQNGSLPAAPMARLLGFTIALVEPGRVVFEGQPDESVYNPIGVVDGGFVCTLADSAAGCAVQTTLDAGVAYTSIDINVTFLRPVTADSGRLRAAGTVVKPGRRVAYATVEVTDGAGKLVAAATSICLVTDPRNP